MATFDPDWQERYADRVASRASALSRVHRGARIFVGSACAEPQYLVQGLSERATEFADAEILHILTLGIAPYAESRFPPLFRHNAFFIGDNTRAAVDAGRADYTPVNLSELGELFRSRRLRLDVALVQVTPPDTHGFVSLGPSVDVTRAAAESARLLIGEVNPNLPRSRGDSCLPADRFHALVPNSAPLLEYRTEPGGEAAATIGRHLARLVAHGSTLQVGIGAVPAVAVAALNEKRDLGVHTELVSDWLLGLVAAGAVTNRAKTRHRGKSLAAFCMGSAALYAYLDDNPALELHPSAYINDPAVIAANPRMVAINSALEVDLTGQVCADSLGFHFHSGVGGQFDFQVGAARSPEGKPIIVLPSTARDGSVSRIVPQLAAGAGVVIPRASTHYVITEWGIADLHGRSIRERAMALIEIAHPRYRKQLLEAARELHFVYPDQIVPAALDCYPAQYEERIAIGDSPVLLRPLKPTDEPLLKELFYSLSDESIYRRYFSAIRYMPHEKLQQELDIDYHRRMAVAAIAEGDGNEQMVGLTQYVLDPVANVAEAAFLVRDDWQGRGLGWHLVRTVAAIARDQGIRALSAVVLPENRAMLHLFHKLGNTVRSRFEEGAYQLEIDL